MITTNIVNSFGAGTQATRFRVDYTDCQAAALTKNVSLFTLKAFGIILSVIVKHTTVFAGTAGTIKVSVGTSGVATQFTAASADLVATAVADTAFQKTDDPDQASMVDTAVVLNVVSSSGNLSGLTAGSVDVYVYYIQPTTPLP